MHESTMAVEPLSTEEVDMPYREDEDSTSGRGPHSARSKDENYIWMGRVDEKLRSLDQKSTTIDRTMIVMSEKIDALQTQVTKLVVYIGFGAFFGSSVVSVIVGIAIKLFGK